MVEESFWDRSWKAADSGKIAAYAEQMGIAEDPLIRYLKDRGAGYVCDAGCGCGLYSLKLAAFGFRVSGFDVSPAAVALAQRLLSEKGCSESSFRTADVCSTGYADGTFDAVVARDVLDHIPVRDVAAALKELKRIVRPGGCVVLTMDKTDDEYESEPHEVSRDGDYLYTAGKWKGMVFHPWSQSGIDRLMRGYDSEILEASGNRYTLALKKDRSEPQIGKAAYGEGTDTKAV